MPPTYMETIGFYRDAARHVATNAGEPARGARRALGSGQATLGLPLLHRPYRECGSQSRELIECDSLRQAYKNDAARRVATVFEKWNFLIENVLHARKESLPVKIEPIRAACRGAFEMRWFKSYSPVS